LIGVPLFHIAAIEMAVHKVGRALFRQTRHIWADCRSSNRGKARQEKGFRGMIPKLTR
jgi:hypothetical protein